MLLHCFWFCFLFSCHLLAIFFPQYLPPSPSPSLSLSLISLPPPPVFTPIFPVPIPLPTCYMYSHVNSTNLQLCSYRFKFLGDWICHDAPSTSSPPLLFHSQCVYILILHAINFFVMVPRICRMCCVLLPKNVLLFVFDIDVSSHGTEFYAF